MIVARDEGVRWCRAVLAACVALGAADAGATVGLAAPRTSAIECSPAGGEVVRVESVTTDLDLKLADGRTVRLAGIDPVRATPAHPDLALDARVRLDTWLRGRDAVLRTLALTPDRWDRVPGLLFGPAEPMTGSTTAPTPALSVGFALVDAGLARVRADPATHACWAAAVETEDAARAAGLGLWADPGYAVRDATNSSALVDTVGGFALVQGRVSRIGHGRVRTYLGFSPGRSGFELRFGKNVAALLAERGLDEGQLIGTTIRARGYLDDRLGAAIEVTDADQIEILGRSRPAIDGAVTNP